MNHRKSDLLFKSSYKTFNKNKQARQLKIIISGLIISILSLALSGANAQVHSTVASPQVAPGGNPPGEPGPISGPTSLTQGSQTTSVYTVSVVPLATGYGWSLSPSTAGTVSISTTTATVTWNASFLGTVTLSCYAINSYGGSAARTLPITMTLVTPLTPGVIGPNFQSIGYNYTPAIIAGAPSGGNDSYTYQWQYASATSPTSFNNISGFTSQSFPTSGYNITATTYFRRMDSSNGSSSPTNTAEFIVYPLSVGNIMPETQDISAGATVFPLSVSSVSGNASTYTYLWQSSPDNINWTSITNATSLSYTPNPVSATTWYRLQITCNGANFYSRSARVLIGNCPQLATNPGTSMNYIATSTFRNAGITSVTDAQIAGMTICDVNQTIQYVDGLGRPIQTVQTKASPTQRDVVMPMAYDQFNRQVIRYLPYEVATGMVDDGSYKTTALTDQASFYSNPTSATWNAPGVVQTSYASGTTNIEPSPLNRPIEQGFPGQSWQVSNSGVPNSGHTVTTLYETNNATSLTSTTGYWAQYYGVTYLWSVGNQNTPAQYLYRNALTNPGPYAYGQLYLTVTRNENWLATQGNVNLNTTQEYKDKSGHVVLKRTFNYNTATSANETLSTYYVYDDYGNLTYVLPPAANPDAGNITQNVLDNLCYQYRYDARNRLREKKIPGKGWQILIYNNLDQLIASQDSVQRMDNPQQVSYIKYDPQSRTAQTGIYTITGTPGTDQSLTLQAAATAQTINWETKSAAGTYSNVTIPTSNTTVLTINYYDDYNNSGAPLTTYTAPTGASNMTRGLLTSSQTSVLNTPADGLWAAQYYDDLGRAIKNYVQHYVGGHTSYSTANYDLNSAYYNFTNQLDTTIRQHYRASSTSPKVTIANFYTYDQVGRRLLNTEQITGNNGIVQPVNVLSQANYNALGQLSSKNIGGSPANTASVVLGSGNDVTSGQTVNVTASNSITMNPGFTVAAGSTFTAQIGSSLQTYDYTYNERGWLTSMAPTTSLATGGNYAETLAYDKPIGVSTPQYNGNISQFSYNSPYMSTQWGQPASYINTVNYAYDNLNRLTQSTSSLAESDEAVSYDLNGNIKTLVRNGPMAASLGYTYLNSGVSNELGAVSNNNAAYRSYTYDGNGNTLDNGDAPSDGGTKNITYNMLNLPQFVQEGSITVTYAYDATGNKLRDVDGSGVTWDYDNGIVYQQGKINFIQNEEGQATLYSDSVTYNYSFNLKDYLGNVRASYDNGGTSGAFRIIQENNYYPFGLSQLYYDNANGNHYLYNGKEAQFDLINQYDYGARFYDAVIARWTTIDPMAEDSRRWSPYNYGENNPIVNIDPDGMETQVGEGQTLEGLSNIYGGNNVQTVIYNPDTQPTQKTTDKSDTESPVWGQQVLNSALPALPGASDDQTHVGVTFTAIIYLTVGQPINYGFFTASTSTYKGHVYGDDNSFQSINMTYSTKKFEGLDYSLGGLNLGNDAEYQGTNRSYKIGETTYTIGSNQIGERTVGSYIMQKNGDITGAITTFTPTNSGRNLFLPEKFTLFGVGKLLQYLKDIPSSNESSQLAQFLFGAN